MALFLHSIKYSRNLRNISKLIQTDGSNKRFLCSASVPNISEIKVSIPTDFYGYQTSELDIDSLIEKVNRNLHYGRLIDKNVIDEIIQCMQIQGKIDSSQAILVLRSCNLLIQCTPEQRIDLATTLWKLFGIYNVKMDASYYNALLKIYLNNKHEFSPLDILSDMKKQSIVPNENTYKELLKYYCMKGNMSGAMTVFQCMKDENHVLTEDVFNSFILGYAQARDLKSAVNVLQIMEKVNLTPTNKTYSALMCAYATYNNMESIKRILFKCRKKGIEFTNEDLLDVIYTLIANKNVDYIGKVLVELKRPFLTEPLEFLAKIIDLKQENMAMKIFYYFYSDIKFKLMKIQYENFIIHKLIYSGVPIEKIVDTCKLFYTCYGNNKIFNQAIYFAFKQNKDLLVSSLLKEWKNKGHKLRSHYFWPFLSKLQKNHDIKGLLEYVKNMKDVYGVVPCINTVADYILPNILTSSMSTVFVLSEYNIPIETTRNAVVYYWLSFFKTKLSADYVTQHPCYYDDFILKSKLRWSLFNTCDIDSYLIIANTLYKETTSGAKEKVSLDEKILDIMNFLKHNPTCISKILQYISKNEISISDNTYKILSEYQRTDSII